MMTTILASTAASAAVLAQAQVPPRSPSPAGSAAIQVGTWKADDKPGARVATGKWIDLIYGRPIKRGRGDLFGAGADYGKTLKGGAPVWRAGANALTRFKTEVPLAFGARARVDGRRSISQYSGSRAFSQRCPGPSTYRGRTIVCRRPDATSARSASARAADVARSPCHKYHA